LRYGFRALERAVEVENNQEQMVMQRIIPIIERQLSNLFDHQRVTYEKLEDMMRNLNLKVSDMSTGGAPLQINLNWPEGPNIPTVSTSTINANNSAISMNASSVYFPLSHGTNSATTVAT
jgi:hypothetical protein